MQRRTSAGMKRPARDMSAARPTAFMAAVLPPVLGPVIRGLHWATSQLNVSTFCPMSWGALLV